MLALKTMQEQLAQAGEKVEEWENAYWAENRMSSRNAEEMKAYRRDHFAPLVKAQVEVAGALDQGLVDELNAVDADRRDFQKLDADAKRRNAVSNYVMLKHGLERNLVLAMRDAIDATHDDAKARAAVWKGYNEDPANIENRRLLSEGKRAFDEFLQVDEAIRAVHAGVAFAELRANDYSGVTSMSVLDEGADLKKAEEAATRLVMLTEGQLGEETEKLWKRMNAATKESVDKLYKGGLLSPGAHEQMTTMFQWYAPLRGYSETTSDEVYDYVNERSAKGGSIVKGAKGRTSKADDPIANIGNMAERSIVQSNRNEMKQHFYRMVMSHPSDLVSVDEVYLRKDDVSGEWEMALPEIPEGATPEQVTQATQDFAEKMRALSESEPDRIVSLAQQPNIPYKVVSGNMSEHQVLVKVLGQDKLMTINGDPRVAHAINGLLNPDARDKGVGHVMRGFNNFLAQMATQRNPSFIFRNLFRDRFYAMEAARVKEGGVDSKYVRSLQKNWVKSLGDVVGLMKAYNTGELDLNDDAQRMFHEFMMNGGATGVTLLLNPEEYKGEIANIAKELQGSKFNPLKIAKLMINFVDFFGTWSEAVTRFATYRTSRERGRSVTRSVWDAKEITTNFNKKGAGDKAIRDKDNWLLNVSGQMASWFRNWVIFTNANIQGFQNQAHIAKADPVRFGLNFVGKWVMLGAAVTGVNAILTKLFGGDDDNYMDLQESVRRNNLCLFVPSVGWVKLPLGFGLRSAYAFGGLMTEQIVYRNEGYSHVASSLADILSDLAPLSSGSSEQPWWMDVIPSSMRSWVEGYVANKDWTGREIVNDNIDKNLPEYKRVNNRTSAITIGIAHALNALSGGDEYSPGFLNFNPSKFEHGARGMLSGVGTLLGNTWETAQNLVLGEDVDSRHIPFFGDFYQNSGGAVHSAAVKRNFYNLKDEYDKTHVRVRGYEKAEEVGGETPEQVARRVDFFNNSKEYQRYSVMDDALSDVKYLKKDLGEATTPEEMKAIEAEILQVMEQAVKDVRAIK